MNDRSDDRSWEMSNRSDNSAHAAHSSPRQAYPDQARTLRCRTIATGRFRQRHHIRDLAPIASGIDAGEQPSLLAEDVEPHPSEMLLTALGACLTTTIQANAVARDIPLRRLEVHTRGDVDPSALWNTSDRRAKVIGFTCLAVEVHVEADVPREALDSLVEHALMWSPVANTLHDPIHIKITLVDMTRIQKQEQAVSTDDILPQYMLLPRG